MADSKINLIYKAWKENPTHRQEFMIMFFREHGDKVKEFLLSECLSVNKSLKDIAIEKILKGGLHENNR